ncbi:MAG: hypothetical protein ABH878_05390, partial [bacterium]
MRRAAAFKKKAVSRFPFIVSGGLAVLAFPPLSLTPCAWLFLVPLLLTARNLSLGIAFRRGWWAGLVFNVSLLYWIAFNTGTSVFIASASLLGILFIVPLYWGIFTLFWAFLSNRWGDRAALALPAIWVGLEVIKNSPEIGFPWQELGLTQLPLLPVAQLAELGGIRLVSAGVIAANVALFLLIRKRLRFSLVLIGLLAITGLWGWWRQNHLPAPGPELHVALLQGNVDPASKWLEHPDSSMVLYEELTRRAAQNQKLHLIIWPETAAPCYL